MSRRIAIARRSQIEVGIVQQTPDPEDRIVAVADGTDGEGRTGRANCT